MGIEEFTDIFRKAKEYDDLDRKFNLVCNKGIQEVLHYITKFGLNNTEITEQQAWKKIAEVTDTVEPKFNPADFYHDMRILFKNADLSVPIRGDKTLYDNGYRIVHKSSLPTQPELVEVPEFVAEWYEEHRNDTLEAKFSRAKTDKDIKVQNWYNNCEGRHANKRANAQEIIAKMTLYDYTVKKEQLYYVKVGNLVFVGWEDSFVAKFATTDSLEWTEYAHKISTKDAAFKVARIIGGYAVPVNQEPKLPQEIGVSEYLEGEE